MLNPVTIWFELTQYDYKKAIIIANLVENMGVDRYSWTTEIMYDRGSEFLGRKFKNTLIKE